MMMKMMNHQDARQQPANEEPRRLTLILNDPSAEWSEIRSAMRAKAKQGNGAVACTNYSLMNALSSNGGGDNSNCSRDSNSPTPKTNDDAAVVREEPQQVAVKKKEDADVPTQAQDTITPLTNRRASLSSQDSSKGSGTTTRPSLRGNRQLSSRRPSNRRLQRGGSSRRLLMLRSSINNNSIRSITESSFNSSASSLNDSSFNLSGSTSKFGETAAAGAGGGGGGRRQHLMHDLHGSINIMDFGISQRALTVASSTALDESSRSLDESALEVFDEEQWNKSGRGLLVSWQHDDSSASLRLIQSFRTRNNGECLSEGDLDSFVDSCGFLDWPATREEAEEEAERGKVLGGRIQDESIIEEVVEQQEEETWNIEDYEGSEHAPDVAEHRLRHNTPSNPIAKTLKMFTRSRRASNASSTSSQEDSIDLSKIKESLLLKTGGKNNKQSMEEVERGGGGSNQQKKCGSMIPVGIFNKSPPTDGRSNVGKISSDDDEEMTTRRSSSQEEIWKRKSSCETAIWVRDSDRDFDVGDLKTMYTNKPDASCRKKRMSWNIFEGVVKNQSQPSQRRSWTND